MKIDFKFIGGIFLIIGTCIGGGMLALPLAAASSGFLSSTLFLFLCWLIMTLGGFLILEVNLWCPRNSNIITMAKKTLGLPGQIIAWISYIVLLYSLLSAYIAGSVDITHGLLTLTSLSISQELSTVLITAAMAVLIYNGVKSADYINRGLIIAKFISFFLLVILLAPRIELPHLAQGEMVYMFGALMVLVAAFGYSTIVPTLRTYFDDDVAKLRWAIIIGSLVPLLFYIIWNAVIMGIIPSAGVDGLTALSESSDPISNLANQVPSVLAGEQVPQLFRFFASVALLTSLLGVSLCLFDFLADGFNSRKQGYQGLIIATITFLPPLIIILFRPGIFTKALSFAGLTCMILLVLLPALMAWRGRYTKGLATDAKYTLPGGKVLLGIIIAIGIGLSLFALGELLYSFVLSKSA